MGRRRGSAAGGRLIPTAPVVRAKPIQSCYPGPSGGSGSVREFFLHHSSRNCMELLQEIAGTGRQEGSTSHLVYLNRLFTSQETQGKML